MYNAISQTVSERKTSNIANFYNEQMIFQKKYAKIKFPPKFYY